MLTGQLVAGRYRLDEEVGAGGMGVVWRATDVALDRVVALKRAHAGAAGSLREAKAAAALHHPNVVTLFDIVEDGTDRWLVMEYLASQSLADLVAPADGAVQPLAPAKVAAIGAQVASALRAVHAIGTLHRDVKPGNVLITADGTAKLCDFGISRPQWGEATLTGAGILGTPAYIAPEVARGEAPSAASDLFALGATLYYAVEGRSPYGEPVGPAELFRRAARGQVLAPRLAGPLAPLLTALLHRDPQRRPEADRVATLFGEVAADAALATAPTRPRRVPTLPRRRTGLVAGAVCAVVVLAVAVVFAVRGAGGGTEQAAAATHPAAPVTGMGEHRGADPCGLVDPGPLGRFGNAQVDSTHGNFDRCDVLIGNGNLLTDLVVVLSDGPLDQAAGTVRQVDGLRVQYQLGRSNECDREIALPDNTKVIVFAQRNSSDRPKGAPYCAIADVATDSAVAALARGPVPRRTVPFPPDSVARSDACLLLPAAALGAHIPGVNADAPDHGFGSWSCTWHSTTSHDQVWVAFDHDQPMSAADGTPLTLSGRRAFVMNPEPGDDDCTARVLNRTMTDADGNPLWELVQVAVRGDEPMSGRCSTASALAAALAPVLPGRSGGA